MKTELMNKMSRSFHKLGLNVKKHSPEILLVAGIAGGVTSAIMACKATTKAGDIIEDTKSQLDIIHKGIEDGNIRGVEYTKEDGRKDLTIVYTQTVVKFIKLYGPAVALGTVSIVSILAGHNITRKRNLALCAAYTTIDNSFKQYRNRVIERFGEELDRELRYDIKAKEVEETVVNEDGTESTVKTTMNIIDPNTISDYSRIFDECNTSWSKSPEHNLVFLKQQQNYANDLLKSRGHLFLNEVYDMLGFPRTQAGQIVGWVYDEKNPVGDNFVDFGIFDLYDERKRDFVNGHERVILLDFNVDGEIFKFL